MISTSLQFPKGLPRPYFYTNFVQTVDGKVQVKKEGYWPIGSEVDHQVLTELRAHADALVHGGNLAKEFGQITIKNLLNENFQNLRIRLHKDPLLPYYIVTNHPQLYSHIRSGDVVIDNLQNTLRKLKETGHKLVLVEGGPTLLGSFLKLNLINEIFLTIAPRIYGSKDQITLTLIEGILFPPDQIKKLKLKSIKRIGDELFLRYQVTINLK